MITIYYSYLKKFNPEHTREENFFNRYDKLLRADLMKVSGKFRIAKLTNPDATALELPYIGDQVTICLTLSVKK